MSKGFIKGLRPRYSSSAGSFARPQAHIKRQMTIANEECNRAESLLKQQDALREALEELCYSIEQDDVANGSISGVLMSDVREARKFLATQPKQPTEGEKDNG